MPIVFGSAAFLLLAAVAVGLFPPLALGLVIILLVSAALLAVRAKRLAPTTNRRNRGPQVRWRQEAEEANP